MIIQKHSYRRVFFSSIRRGYTMVELLIYMALLVTFLTVLSALFGSAIDIQLDSEATTGVALDATYILSKMTYDMHRAQSIVTPAAPGNSSNTLVIRINNVNHTYASDSNGNLTYTNNLGSFQLTTYTASIAAMTFTNISHAGSSEDTVKIYMSVVSRIPQPKGAEQQVLQTTLGLRRQQ